VLGKPVVSKDQRVERVKWSDIKVQIHTITSGKIMGKLAISEMVLFDEPSNKQKATRGVVNVFRW